MDNNYQPQNQPQDSQPTFEQPIPPAVDDSATSQTDTQVAPQTDDQSILSINNQTPLQVDEPVMPQVDNQVPPQTDTQTDTQTAQQADNQLANMSNEEVVANFAKGLLIEKNLGEMDENTKKDMIQDLIERINDFINRAVLESLPKEKLDELDSMIDNDTATPEAVAQLIQDSGIDASAAAVKAMEKFREVYLGTDAEQEA